MRIHMCLLAVALAVGGLTASNESRAMIRFDFSNATGVCQAALPVYDGNIRKRPTAVSNEGAAPVFVSCSLTNDAARAPAIFAGIGLNNNGAASATVNCSMINGYKNINAPPLGVFPKTFTIAAGGSAEREWNVNDNGGEPYLTSSFNFSCQLPVGVEIAYVYTIYEDGSAASAPAP